MSGTTNINAMVERAREATTRLRDSARTGVPLGFRERDPLVMAIHEALDALQRTVTPTHTSHIGSAVDTNHPTDRPRFPFTPSKRYVRVNGDGWEQSDHPGGPWAPVFLGSL